MIEFVKTNGTGAYKVTYKDGTKKNVRLFYSQSYAFICEFKKGSRTRGYYFSLDNVAEISKPEAKPENEIFRNNAIKDKAPKTFTKLQDFTPQIYDFLV